MITSRVLHSLKAKYDKISLLPLAFLGGNQHRIQHLNDQLADVDMHCCEYHTYMPATEKTLIILSLPKTHIIEAVDKLQIHFDRLISTKNNRKSIDCEEENTNG